MNNNQTVKQTKPWEEWELQYLQENYSKVKASEIAAYLNRTSGMVRAAAQRHGLCTNLLHHTSHLRGCNCLRWNQPATTRFPMGIAYCYLSGKP